MNVGWIRDWNPSNGNLLCQIDLGWEQGEAQFVRTAHPPFSPNGDMAYITTSFGGDGVGQGLTKGAECSSG